MIGAVLVALLWMVSVPVRIWWDARQEDRRASDAIVVLGAAQYGGRPSPVLEARLRKAQTLWNDGIAPVVVTVGGGAPGDDTTEAEAGRDWLTANGMPADAVVAVAEGNNTQTSMEAVGEVFDDRDRIAVLVTDPWHTFRSKALADAAGIDAVAAPARSDSRSRPARRSCGTSCESRWRTTAGG